MTTVSMIWLSTDGAYYALPAPSSPSAVAYDVLEVDGPKVWLAQRYNPLGWEDTDVRYTHAEFPGMIGSWTNHGRWTRGRTRYIEAFSTEFMDIRQDIQLSPYSCRPDTNPYLGCWRATFRTRRRVSAARWQTLQARVEAAIQDGTTRLYALHPQHGGGSHEPSD